MITIRNIVVLIGVFCLGYWFRGDDGVYVFNLIKPKASPSIQIRELLSGDDRRAERISFRRGSYDIYRVRLGEGNLRLYWTDESDEPFRSFQRLRDYLADKGETLLFATNGGIFTSEHKPEGLYVEDGEELSPLNLQEGLNGNFYIKPNGVFFLSGNGAGIVEAKSFKDIDRSTICFAIQSGPILLDRGVINNSFEKDSSSAYIRSGVGVINSGHVVFVISNQPISFFEFASFFKEMLHCSDALYLDGAISLMYAPELARYETGGDFVSIIALVENAKDESVPSASASAAATPHGANFW